MNATKKTQHISTNDPEAFSTAAHILAQDGVIAFPTDTVYGIGVRFDSEIAIQKLFKIKGRDFNKPIVVSSATLEDFQKVAIHIPLSAYQLAEKFLPGALTLIVPKHPALPSSISTFPTIGIRIPNHPFALTLLNQVGPLAVTSANLSNHPDTQNGNQVLHQLDGLFDLLIDGGQTPGGVASTVVDVTTETPKILRQGPITQTDILNHLS